MFYSTLFLATTALCGIASAQNFSTNPPYTVDPGTVDYDTRLAWCRSQTATCPLICGGQAYPNNCSADTLTYTCTCTDGSSPNISAYGNTLPSLECGNWQGQCVAAYPNDLSGQTACLSVACGMKNASDVPMSNSGGSSSSAAPSSSATGSSGGSGPTGTGGAAAATNTGAAMALSVGQSYGVGILATCFLAAFGLAL